MKILCLIKKSCTNLGQQDASAFKENKVLGKMHEGTA